MNHLADVSKATNTFVLAADHFGKDISAGTRGSVVKEASADTILAVLGERDPETNIMDDTRIVLRKQRSGPQGEEFPFAARLVDMGADRDGEPLTSRVIDWLDERPEKPKQEKKSETQLLLEEALAQTFKTRPQQVTVNGAKIEAVKEEDLRATFSDLYKRGRPDASANAIKQARWRAFEKMQKAIMQEVVDGVLYVWYPPTPF